MNMKKLFLLNLPYLLFVYPFDKLAQAFRLAPGSDLSGKLLSIGDGFTAALSSPWLSFQPTDLLIGIAGAVVLRMAVYLKGKNAKKYRHGIEYGSARWGTAADIAPYMDKDFFQNIPMTQTERITMASRPKQPKYARNKNILVIGGSGSGKTRFFCKPSLLQAHSSYVCTDPKGTLLPEIGTFLERKKYRIKCLNLINFRKSMRYNPLAYIRSEKDILKLVNALIMNTKGEGEKSSEDFWVKAERLYYSALIGYIWYEATEEEKNFITLLDLINASEAREDDETYQSPVDLLFSQLEEREPEALSGAPFDVRFISFDDIKADPKVLDGIDVLINVGDGDTAHTGGKVWEDPAISSAVKGFVHRGGGLIGVGEPGGHQYQGRYLQLAAPLGVEKETGFTLNYDKYNWDEHRDHFILADCPDHDVDFGEGKKSIFALEGTEILIQRDKEVQMAAHEYGKGRGVYISGLPYSFVNNRVLYRAILWAAHDEADLHKWFSTNYNVEVHAYVKNGKYCVVNNTYEPQDTTVYTGDGSSFTLHMDANEIKWYNL